jgi:hypothetical protein
MKQTLRNNHSEVCEEPKKNRKKGSHYQFHDINPLQATGGREVYG